MPTTQIQSTTQEFIDIYDITNDITIMKDGACSLIITVDALNFGLLAEEEQDAIMYSYAGLLNSLNYPVQIVIRSQTKDATNYLNLLREQELKASSELKKSQIRAYASFVADLIRERNVLDKKFYIIIPVSALEMGLLPPSTVVPGVKQVDVSTIERSVILDKAKTILEPKRDHLISQFNRIGLFARQLNTQEIIQLFYTSYNPEAAEGQQITNSNDYTTPLVTGQTTMTDTTPTPLTVAQADTVPATQPDTYAAPIAQLDIAPEMINDALPAAAPQTLEPAMTDQPMTNAAPAYNTATIDQTTIQAPPSTSVFDASATPPAAAATATDPAAAELQAVINMTAQQVTPSSYQTQPPSSPLPPATSSTPLTPATPASADDLPPLPEI